MRISTKIMAEHIKANLNKQTRQLMDSQLKIATEKRINSLSDDPQGIGKVLGYRTSLSSIAQYQQNITDAKTRVEYTETILGEVNDLVAEAKKIASNADTDNKEALAQEVANIRDQIMSLANTKYAGSFIFSGDATDTPSFDEASGNYTGDSGPDSDQNVIVGDGVQVSLQADGSQIFIEGGVNNVFSILDTLEADLLADNEAGISAAVDPLSRLDDQLELVRSQFASAYGRLKNTDERWTTLSNAVETMRSNVEDADVAEAAVDLQLQQTSYEMLLKVAAQVIQPTLVDFLG